MWSTAIFFFYFALVFWWCLCVGLKIVNWVIKFFHVVFVGGAFWIYNRYKTRKEGLEEANKKKKKPNVNIHVNYIGKPSPSFYAQQYNNHREDEEC